MHKCMHPLCAGVMNACLHHSSNVVQHLVVTTLMVGRVMLPYLQWCALDLAAIDPVLSPELYPVLQPVRAVLEVPSDQ